MRRFIEADEIFAKRFAADLNKYFSYCINGEITDLIEYLMTELIECFDSYINCQINEKAAKSKAADINYQDLHFAVAIIEKIIYEIDTNQNYLYCYHSNFDNDSKKKKKTPIFSNYTYLHRSINYI